MRTLAFVTVGILGISFGSVASADDNMTAGAVYSVGARVGGYGFREQDEEGKATWDDCRMNGLGLFGQRALTRHVMLEAGLDTYFADQTGLPGHDHGGGDADVMGEGMDRVSTIGTFGAALNLMPGYRVTPTLGAGVGVELTRVSMPGHDDASRVLPMGYLAIGVDGRVWKTMHLGANVRMNAMGHFDHDDPNMTEMKAEPELASQGQFYLRVDL